jgi:4-diphosphocytidyl-2-C-methyl-D-erythritol kinase
MAITRFSPGKVNFLLNTLGLRPDGFHELETLMHPVAFGDTLHLEAANVGVSLTCNEPALPVDGTNLVVRAANAFFQAGVEGGVKIHLEKTIPLASGLGGGSSNAANTLLGLNQLFNNPLSSEKLATIARGLGSDVPFFLQDNPAVATGRGEKITVLEPFARLKNLSFLLVHPGFGVATAWAYQQLAQFPEALNGQLGRAGRLAEGLRQKDLAEISGEFYNALEAPVMSKYPILLMYQEFFRSEGACVSLMSGSGSTTFAIFQDAKAAERVAEMFPGRFGARAWLKVVPIG